MPDKNHLMTLQALGQLFSQPRCPVQKLRGEQPAVSGGAPPGGLLVNQWGAAQPRLLAPQPRGIEELS